MKDLLKELYSCYKCRDTYLKGEICTQFPEPFLGILEEEITKKFAIIGINPGWTDDSEITSLEKYIKFYMNHGPNKNARWFKGYFEAYKRLVDLEATYYDFIENVVILNVVHCPTIDIKSISKKNRQAAINNCMHFLIRQLSMIQPRVILVHGQFACEWIIEILEKGVDYKIQNGSCNLETLENLNMGEKSKEYMITKNKEGYKTLFLFNKHLSYYGPAINSLNKNIDQKRIMIGKMLKQR